jgi:hypothetical protein
MKAKRGEEKYCFVEPSKSTNKTASPPSQGIE